MSCSMAKEDKKKEKEDANKKREEEAEEKNHQEEAKREEEAEERKRQEEDKTEEEAEEKKRQEEAKREEEGKKRHEEAEEKLCQEEAKRAEEEKKRQEEAEEKKRQEEAEEKKCQEEAEEKKRQEEAEEKKRQEEAKREEEEKKRQEEAEEKKRQEEAEEKKRQEEAEEKKRQEDAQSGLWVVVCKCVDLVKTLLLIMFFLFLLVMVGYANHAQRIHDNREFIERQARFLRQEIRDGRLGSCEVATPQHGNTTYVSATYTLWSASTADKCKDAPLAHMIPYCHMWFRRHDVTFNISASVVNQARTDAEVMKANLKTLEAETVQAADNATRNATEASAARAALEVAKDRAAAATRLEAEAVARAREFCNDSCEFREDADGIIHVMRSPAPTGPYRFSHTVNSPTFADDYATLCHWAHTRTIVNALTFSEAEPLPWYWLWVGEYFSIHYWREEHTYGQLVLDVKELAEFSVTNNSDQANLAGQLLALIDWRYP